MDIFVLNTISNYSGGEVINGYDSALWVERFDTPGEFKIVGPATDALRSKLPLGALISHSETRDVMMVENHEINEELDGIPKITISGRSLMFFLDERVSTGDALGQYDFASNTVNIYQLTAANTWDQLVGLIGNQIEGSVLNAMDSVPNLHVTTTFSGTESPQREKAIKRGSLYPVVVELLQSISGGIRVERPLGATTTLNFIIHPGVDLRASVRFAYTTGDIQKAKYFWSNKSERNGAYIIGKYASEFIRPSGPTGFGVKLMVVDATDYDNVSPGTPAAEVTRVLLARGNEALAQQDITQLLEATISADAPNRYRTDYNIGDVVFVVGNYGVYAPMRVIEYAETWNQGEQSGFPTLKAL